MHFKVVVRSSHAPNAGRWFPHRCSEGCQCIVVVWWIGLPHLGLPYAIRLPYKSKPHVTTVSSLSATRVTTLWLKQPTCFCSAAFAAVSRAHSAEWCAALHLVYSTHHSGCVEHSSICHSGHSTRGVLWTPYWVCREVLWKHTKSGVLRPLHECVEDTIIWCDKHTSPGVPWTLYQVCQEVQ